MRNAGMRSWDCGIFPRIASGQDRTRGYAPTNPPRMRRDLELQGAGTRVNAAGAVPIPTLACCLQERKQARQEQDGCGERESAFSG
jgi:hypothetical protein